MQIRVDKDNLRIIKLSQLESGEVDVTEVEFIFTSEYKDLIKTAVFTLGDKSYKVILQNDKCYIPTEVLVEGNKITIGVYAFKSEGEELILRYSPVPVTAEILKGSYVEEAENTSHPTPTEIEQLLDLINSNSIAIDDLSERIDTLEQDKDKCEEDIDSIKDDLIDIKSDIDDIEDDITSIRSDITNINENIDTIEGNISDLNDDISDINTEITRINNVDERQNRRLNGIDNFIRQWPKTDYQTGSLVNLGKTIQAPVQYEDDKVMYGNAEQEGTPTPTELIPISVVTGTQEVVVRGKNLVPEYDEAITKNGVTLSQEGYVYTINGTSTNYADISNTNRFTLKAGKYSFQRQYISGSVDANVQFIVKKVQNNGDRGSMVITPSNYTANNTTTFTLTEDTELYLMLYVGASGRTFTNYKIKMMITSGEEQDLNFEPYITPTTYQVHLGNMEFAGIGDYADYPYFNLDEGKWYKKKVIEKLILNGTENWNNTYTAFGLSELINKSIASSGGLCNYFVYDSKNSGMTSLTNYKFAIQSISGKTKSSIYIQYTDITSVADFKTWLSTHNTIVYYPLETSTDEEITDTTLIADLDNILAMMSVEGTTIIEVSGNLPATIKVRAFAQLQAAT